MVSETQDQVKEYEQQYQDGLITQGEKYNKVIDAWSQCTDDVADAMMEGLEKVEPGEAGELGLHDGAFRCAWFGCSDETACWYARPDGQAVR